MADTMPNVPNPGPDVAAFVRELNETYTREHADGSLPPDSWQQLQDAARVHVEAVTEGAENFDAGEWTSLRAEGRNDIREAVDGLRENHPDLDLATMQSGDVSAAELVRAIEPTAHDGVNMEAAFNREVIDIKQELLDLARESIEIRSQAEGANTAETDAQMAHVNALQAELDAARDAVELHAAAAHKRIEDALPAAERLDQVMPHAGQTSETGPAVPSGPVADASAVVVVAYADVAPHDVHPADDSLAVSVDAAHPTDHGGAAATHASTHDGDATDSYGAA